MSGLFIRVDDKIHVHILEEEKRIEIHNEGILTLNKIEKIKLTLKEIKDLNFIDLVDYELQDFKV